MCEIHGYKFFTSAVCVQVTLHKIMYEILIVISCFLVIYEKHLLQWDVLCNLLV